MNTEAVRTIRVAVLTRKPYLAVAIQDVLPRLGMDAETIALYFVVCAFLGLTVCVALSSALP